MNMMTMARPMTSCVAATLVLAAGALGLVGRAQSTVGGVWEILLDTQTGETVWTATFEQDGGTLSGEVDIGDRMILPLTGTVDGAAIEFEFIVPDLDGDMPINLSGEVEGSTIRGDEGSFIWYGAGRWTGTKQ